MIRPSRRQAFKLVGLLAGFAAGSAVLPSAAQTPTFPSRPIRIVVPHAPGGNSDTFGRIVAQKITDQTGQQAVVENRPGAGGTVGSALVSKAAPDGYTVVVADNGTHAIAPTLYGAKLPYDVFKDFTPIMLAAKFPTVIMLHPSVPATTSKEFVVLAKSQPGKFTYSSAGTGNGSHLTMELFRSAAGGLDMVHVPYKGGPDAIQAVLKGDVCCIFNQVQTIMQHYKAGKVRLLGVTTKKRVAAIPDVPTIDEAGVPGYESYTWFAIFGPKGVDPAIARKFNAAIKVALDDPETQKKLAELGNTPRYETIEQFTATVKRDRAKWAEVVNAVGAKVD